MWSAWCWLSSWIWAWAIVWFSGCDRCSYMLHSKEDQVLSKDIYRGSRSIWSQRLQVCAANLRMGTQVLAQAGQSIWHPSSGCKVAEDQLVCDHMLFRRGLRWNGTLLIIKVCLNQEYFAQWITKRMSWFCPGFTLTTSENALAKALHGINFATARFLKKHGFDAASSNEIFEFGWSCEHDRACQKMLKATFPSTCNFDDVFSLGKGSGWCTTHERYCPIVYRPKSRRSCLSKLSFDDLKYDMDLIFAIAVVESSQFEYYWIWMFFACQGRGLNVAGQHLSFKP